MKPGSRALGIAESFTTEQSTLAGVVMTAAGRIDDFVFGTCTVGGTDLTDALVDMIDRLDREDVRVVMLSGVALAWFNIVDIEVVTAAIDRPTIAVTYEQSDGLEGAIEDAFEDEAAADRLARYRSLPDRHPHDLDDGTIYLRASGCSLEEATEVVDRFSSGGATRPDPLRIAGLAARRLDDWRTTNALTSRR